MIGGKAKRITKERALERLEALCATSEQAEYDLRQKLYKWGLPSDEIDEVIDSLRERRFFDDHRFAHAFVNDKVRFNRWGRKKIWVALAAKRVDLAIVSDAMDSIDEEEYRQSLLVVLRSKARMIGDDAHTFEGRTRLLRYAASRGYEPSLIIELIKSGEVWAQE